MVPKRGLARLRLRHLAIGPGGAASTFRASQGRALSRYPPGDRYAGSSPGGGTRPLPPRPSGHRPWRRGFELSRSTSSRSSSLFGRRSKPVQVPASTIRNKKGAQLLDERLIGFEWCRRGDSTPHGFPHHPLKMACLPGSTTSARFEESTYYPRLPGKSRTTNSEAIAPSHSPAE